MYYNLGKFKNFTVGDFRGQVADYSDPFIPNFKFLLDSNKNYGLFATETFSNNKINKNSALYYLKAIGDEARYNMLKSWIALFKTFVKYYDFLILQVDGLEQVYTNRPENTFAKADSRLSLIIREPIDMYFQSLITTYREIAFDTKRGVEILPSNLRSFTFGILVFSSGLYNMAIYDDVISNFNPSTVPDKNKVLPTLRKLSFEEFSGELTQFNNLFFAFSGVEFDLEESGKPLITSVSNEPGNTEFIKNVLSFKYKFVDYDGSFANTIGPKFSDIIALQTVQDRLNNAYETVDGTLTNSLGLSKTKTISKDGKQTLLSKWIKEKNLFPGYKATLLDRLEQFGLKKLKQLDEQTYMKIFSNNSSIGNLLNNIGINGLDNMFFNALNVGIDYGVHKYIDTPLTKVNNFINTNFGNNMVNLYDNIFGPNTSSGVYPLGNNNVYGTDNNYKQGGQLDIDSINVDNVGNQLGTSNVLPQELQGANEGGAIFGNNNTFNNDVIINGISQSENNIFTNNTNNNIITETNDNHFESENITNTVSTTSDNHFESENITNTVSVTSDNHFESENINNDNISLLKDENIRSENISINISTSESNALLESSDKNITLKSDNIFSKDKSIQSNTDKLDNVYDNPTIGNIELTEDNIYPDNLDTEAIKYGETNIHNNSDKNSTDMLSNNVYKNDKIINTIDKTNDNILNSNSNKQNIEIISDKKEVDGSIQNSNIDKITNDNIYVDINKNNIDLFVNDSNKSLSNDSTNSTKLIDDDIKINNNPENKNIELNNSSESNETLNPNIELFENNENKVATNKSDNLRKKNIYGLNDSKPNPGGASNLESPTPSI